MWCRPRHTTYSTHGRRRRWRPSPLAVTTTESGRGYITSQSRLNRGYLCALLTFLSWTDGVASPVGPAGRGKEHVREEDAGGVEAHFRREPVEPSVLLLSAGIPFKFLSFDFVLGGDGSGSSDSDDDVSETP